MDAAKGVPSREAAFHDALVGDVDPHTLPPGEPDMWERAILEGAGDVATLRIVDLGCGTGDLTLRLGRAGAAEVVGVDISPTSISLATRRAEIFEPDTPVRFVTGDAHDTGLATGTFDLVVGKLVLHHLELGRALDEIERLLRPSGRAVFIETSALNPALMFARRYIVHADRFGTVKMGTADEHPLRLRDLRLVRRRFPGATVDFPVFMLALILNRNVLQWRSDTWNRRLWTVDHWFERRGRLLGPLSYYLRIRFQRT
jgi:SAM-dependent methyltransferase